MLVLNEISDDYEEPSHIRDRVMRLSVDCGLPVESSDISRALTDLVRLGWARAYNLWKDPMEELQNAPPLEHVAEFYYWITPKGREIQLSFEGWPFSEEGAILSDWSPR